MVGGARREEEKGFGEEGQGREEGEADVSPARIGGVLAGFWKRNRCGVTASCLPILVGPTILLPFKGLRAGGAVPVSPGSAFGSAGGTREGLFWSSRGLQGFSATEALGKRTKGISWCLGKGGDSQERPQVTHFSTSRC